MHRHLIYLLALMALFTSCSDDEPQAPANGSPTQSDFQQKIPGKTWVLSDTKYVDSAGHIFNISGMSPGYFFTDGYLFTESDVRCAESPYHDNKYSFTAKWQYDAEQGRLFIFTTAMNPNRYSEVVGIDDYKLVIHTEFGCLPKGRWEYENGLAYTGDEGMDEGSYARLVYRPLAADESPADFWAKYPAK